MTEPCPDRGRTALIRHWQTGAVNIDRIIRCARHDAGIHLDVSRAAREVEPVVLRAADQVGAWLGADIRAPESQVATVLSQDAQAGGAPDLDILQGDAFRAEDEHARVGALVVAQHENVAGPSNTACSPDFYAPRHEFLRAGNARAVAVREASVHGVILHSAPDPGFGTFHHGLKLAVLDDIRKPVTINLQDHPILTLFHYGALRGEQARGRNVQAPNRDVRAVIQTSRGHGAVEEEGGTATIDDRALLAVQEQRIGLGDNRVGIGLVMFALGRVLPPEMVIARSQSQRATWVKAGYLHCGLERACAIHARVGQQPRGDTIEHSLYGFCRWLRSQFAQGGGRLV